MNLKESFRYQKFLDSLMMYAASSIKMSAHCLKTTREHLRNAANPAAQNETEVVDNGKFFANDDVIAFMQWLVEEKERLSNAITAAKAASGIDIDAAVETNKLRQQLSGAVKYMLEFRSAESKTEGKSYMINAEGNQTPYYYEIKVKTEEAYDRNVSRDVMRSMITAADQASAKIDAALVNTELDYTPVYDVNESFDDVMEAFVANR